LVGHPARAGILPKWGFCGQRSCEGTERNCKDAKSAKRQRKGEPQRHKGTEKSGAEKKTDIEKSSANNYRKEQALAEGGGR
jgi:hypothetical protein